MIEVLRLNHRVARDPRISTHVALTARAFGATKIFYSGQKDKSLEESVNKITDKFGGPFEIEYVDNDLDLIKEKKKNSFIIVHLTMYGEDFRKFKNNLNKDKILVIVGGEKVEPEFYQVSDYHLSVSNQPISEVSGLGIFLYDLFGYGKFKNAKLEIVGQAKGKLIKKH